MRCLAAVLLLIILGAVARGQEVPTNEEASMWMMKGSGASDVGRGWPQSYHLTARVRYEAEGKVQEGTFEISAAATDRYRLDFKLGEIFATEMALGERYYVLRSKPDENHLPVIERFLVASLVFHPLMDLTATGVRVSRVWLEPNVEGNQICMEAAGDDRYAKQECFDAKTRGLVSATIRDLSKYASDPSATALQASDFVDVGKLRYPRKIKKQFLTGTAEIEVDKFEETETFEENLFTPPAGATSREWCAKPAITRPERPGMPASAMRTSGMTVPEMVPATLRGPMGRGNGPNAYRYILVGPDGKAELATPLASVVNGKPGGPVHLLNETYPVHACNGKGIEYEMVGLMATSIGMK
jgi:hypothetical protein